MLGFNDTSNFVGHFVSNPRERKKRDSRGDEREGQGKGTEMKEKKQKNRNIPPTLLPATRIAGFAQL